MRKKLMKRISILAMLFSAMFLGRQFGEVQVLAQSSSQTELTILHLNDIHGRVVDGIGFARLSTIVDQFRDENPNTLVLDAGDTTHGLPIATLFEGESIIRLMNAIGYDAMVPGNHDFNYGWQRLLELDKMANFPILAANVTTENGEDLLTPYIIKEVDGVKLGIFGLTTPETAFKTHPRNVEGLTFVSPSEVAAQMVERLEPQVDVIIALGHLGVDQDSFYTSTKVIDEVDGIDLFIDGHSHTLFPEGYRHKDTLLVSAGEHAQHLGVVNLVVEDGDLISAEARVIPAEAVADVPEDPEILQIIDELLQEIERLGAEEIGYTSVPLEGERDIVRTSESNLGNLITDVFLSVSDADVALTNGGGIRDSIVAGTIRVGDITRVFPFGNSIEVKQVTGQIIKDALEHGTSALPGPSGGFPQVGGMSFTVDLSRPAGDRVVDIRIGNEPLDLLGEYKLATNDFIAAGGDGYEMIAGAPSLQQMMTMDEALISYIREHEVIEPKVEGRITVRNGEEESGTISVKIVHTNDIHGRVVDGIGFARLSTLVSQFRAENANTLVLDAGDTVHGLPIANLFGGESIINLMNAVGYDAMVAGNHDFNFGQERLLELNELAKFPIMGGNIIIEETGETFLQPYTIKELDGVKVGIFSLSTTETPVSTHPRNVEGLTFRDPSEVAKEMVELLEPQVDIIIALGHLGVVANRPSSSLTVIDNVDGIDVFVDGHCHTLLPEGRMVNDTLLVSAGDHLNYVGVVDLVIEEGEVVSAQAKTLSEADVADIEKDPNVVAIIDDYESRLGDVQAEIIGFSNVYLSNSLARSEETAIGNLIADAMIAASEADIAMTNGGGIRSSIADGHITIGDVLAVLPFGNEVVVQQVTGTVLKEILEHGTSAYPRSAGRFPQVAGMEFVIDLSRPEGDRVVDIRVGGEPLDLEREYTFATNDFVAAGGDGYGMLVDVPVIQELMQIDEAVVEYIREHETISPAIEGRITSRTESEGPETPGCPECPESPEDPECPECPECPEHSECPKVPECPEHPECPENPGLGKNPQDPGRLPDAGQNMNFIFPLLGILLIIVAGWFLRKKSSDKDK